MWGGGLFRAHAVLSALDENPQLLDRARGRFDEPPPSYRSISGATTCLPSPDHRLTEEEQCREARFQLKLARQASHPYRQYFDQINEA